jgi:hypothetical protein
VAEEQIAPDRWRTTDARGRNDHHRLLIVLGDPLVQSVSQNISPDSIREAIATVFARREYDRTIASTIWSRIVNTLLSWFFDLLQSIRHAGPVQKGALVVLLVVVIAVIARLAIVSNAAGVAFRRAGTFGSGGQQDAWTEAQRLASAGQYTDAAHALYLGLLDDMARRDQIQLHYSKTVGDYGRDLRRRSSGLAPRYRDFARTYETVVYGLGTCDRERYERLYALATGIVQAAA